jgi:hypothetical protein
MTAVKPCQWLAWLATVCLIASAVMASLNMYPYDIMGFMVSNTMWIIVGVVWQEKSLIVMNSALTLIYIAGIAHSYLTL